MQKHTPSDPPEHRARWTVPFFALDVGFDLILARKDKCLQFSSDLAPFASHTFERMLTFSIIAITIHAVVQLAIIKTIFLSVMNCWILLDWISLFTVCPYGSVGCSDTGERVPITHLWADTHSSGCTVRTCWSISDWEWPSNVQGLMKPPDYPKPPWWGREVVKTAWAPARMNAREARMNAWAMPRIPSALTFPLPLSQGVSWVNEGSGGWWKGMIPPQLKSHNCIENIGK